jgi:hypothetical protein
VVLLVLFNICFVAPLGAIFVTLAFAGERAKELLASGRKKLETHWPAVLAGLFLLAGVFVTLLGASGLIGMGHGHVGRFARHLRRIIHP